MRLWPRKRFGVFALDPLDGIILGPAIYRYFFRAPAVSTADHLTRLASIGPIWGAGDRAERPPLKYVVRRLR